MYGRCTYDVLGQILFDIHNEFGLNIEKLTHTVTVGGSNYCKAFRVFGVNQNSTQNQEPSHNEEPDEDDEYRFSDDEDEYEDEDDIEGHDIE